MIHDYLFFGNVGSGKGTQVKLLMDYLIKKENATCLYVGTGEGFRSLVSKESYFTNLINDLMLQGELLPDFLTNAVFADALIEDFSPLKNLFIDGYPRTLVQAENFFEIMKFLKRESVKIICIDVSREEALKRNLLRGRKDDTSTGIQKRFNEYQNKVIPAMNYFEGKENYQIYHINGEQSPTEVHQDILKTLSL